MRAVGRTGNYKNHELHELHEFSDPMVIMNFNQIARIRRRKASRLSKVSGSYLCADTNHDPSAAATLAKPSHN